MDDLNMPKPDDFSLNLSGEVSKKKKNKWPILIAAAALAAITVAILWTPVKNLIWKDEPATLQELERDAWISTLDELIDVCDSWVVFGETEPVGKNVHLEFYIDEVAMAFIKNQYPDLAVLDVLNSVSADLDYDNDGDKLQLTVKPAHDLVDLPEGKAVLDFETQYLYLLIPTLSDSNLKLDLNVFSGQAKLTAVLGQLPDAEQLHKVANAYVDDFVNIMNVQEASADTVSIGDVRQKCTKYTAEINMIEFLNVAISALNEFEALCENESELAMLIRNGQQELELLKNNTSDDETLFWMVYADVNGDVIGRQIKRETGDSALHYLCVRNDDALALEFTVFDLAFTGSASFKDDKLGGTFYLLVDEVKYLEIKPDDVDLKALADGKLKGKVKVTASKELTELIFRADPGLSLAFDVDFNITPEASRITLSYMDLASVSVFMTDHDPDTITIPDGTEIDGSANDALYRWLQSMDMDRLKSLLSPMGISTGLKIPGA